MSEFQLSRRLVLQASTALLVLSATPWWRVDKVRLTEAQREMKRHAEHLADVTLSDEEFLEEWMSPRKPLIGG